MADDVGRRDVDDVRLELLKIAANAAIEAQTNTVLRPPGDRDRRQADEVAGWLEGRLRDRRRIDPHLRALFSR